MSSQEEEKKQEKATENDRPNIEHMKKISESVLDVAWSMTVYDIENTLRTSIDKLFRDKSVDKYVRKLRAKGLLKLGKIFESYGEISEKGI
jgi:hypothetical protein